MRKTIFRFANIPYGAGFAEIRFVRESTPEETTWNPSAEEILIDVASELILQKPDDEEIAESKTGNPVISELSLKLLDTFQSGFLQTNNFKIGLTGYVGSSEQAVLSKAFNFSLFSLITQWSVKQAVSETPATILPPNGIDIELYINGSHKRTALLSYDAIGWDEEFLYGQPLKAEHLANSFQFFRYDAAEKVIDIVGRDKIKWMLEQFDPSQSDHWGGSMWLLNPDAPGTYLPRPYDGAGLNGPRRENMTTRVLWWPSSSSADSRRSRSWQAYSISAIFKCIYDRCFGVGKYTVESERCKWRFKAAGIPFSSFIENGSGGYRPYLCKRENTLNPENHRVTDKFNLIKIDDEDQEIFLHRQYVHIPLGQKPYPYSFTKYGTGWEVITRLAASFGYRIRFTWKNGIPHIIHKPRTRKPPRVKLPAFIKGSSKVTPHESTHDAVLCSPYTDYGDYPSHRHLFEHPSFDLSANGAWETYSKLLEPVNDQTNNYIDWDAEVDYFSVGRVRNEENKPLFEELHAPKSGQKYKNVFECKTCFGLFANLMYYGFGEAAGEENHMSPEFPAFVLGSLADMFIENGSDNHSTTESPYPGLILMVGGSPDGGRTIDETIDTEGGDPVFEATHPEAPPGWSKYITRFHRGCGTIEVPFGDGGQYITCHTSEEALAVDFSQYKLGARRKQTLKLPGLSEYENDLGQVGWDAVYTGLSALLYSLDMEILRVKKSMEDDSIEIDVEEIPAMEIVPTPEPIVAETYETCSRTIWRMGPDYFWRGDGNDVNEQHRHRSENDGNCECGGSGGAGGGGGKIPPRTYEPREPDEPAITIKLLPTQTEGGLLVTDHLDNPLFDVTATGEIGSNGIYVTEGPNAMMGSAVLASGTVVIATNKVTANSRIFLQYDTIIGTPGTLGISARTAGVSFTVTSFNGGVAETGDNSRISWFIAEPR